MIGYNAEEINNLVRGLNASYAKLGEAMATGWDTVVNTLGAEWIGPDEVSFETEFASRMCTLYYSCRESVVGMIENVRMLGQSWQEFQNSNLMQGVAAMATVGFDIIGVTLDDYKIEDKVKSTQRTFAAGTRMGVTNGVESATNINSKITEYVNNIGAAVKAMYDQTSSATAFLGAKQADAIDSYLKKMAGSFSKVTTQVNDLQKTLKELVKNYNEQMAAFAKTVNKIDTNISK